MRTDQCWDGVLDTRRLKSRLSLGVGLLGSCNTALQTALGGLERGEDRAEGEDKRGGVLARKGYQLFHTYVRC